MAILNAELEFFKAATVDDTASNGGLMSANEYVSGAVQNVWPHALKAERDAGSTKYRKIFLKVSNDSDLTLLSGMCWLDQPTPADDWVVAFVGTQSDIQSGIGTPRLYGCAALKTNITAGGSTIVVDVEDATLTGIFASGDTVRLTDMTDPTNDATGNEEFLTIASAPSVSGTEVTITVSETIANSYTVAGDTRAMSIIDLGDVECSVDNWVETSTSGTYDESAYPVVCDNIGTIEQEWTLEFTDASNFTCVGDTVGSVTSGNITTDFTPDNSDFTKPYFTLEFAGFSGTWASGETIVFQTHPAAGVIWEKRVIPALATSLSGNKAVLVYRGESA